MKILLSNAVVSHGAFHHWMTADLRAIGHQVDTIDPDELCEQFGIELWRRTCLQRIAAERPHVLMLYPPYDLLRPEDHEKVRAMGTVIVGFAYDDPIFLGSYQRAPGDFERITGEFLKTYDIYLSTSREMVRACETRGIKGYRTIRWACNTPPVDPADRVRDLPLVVIGAPYPRRVKMVKFLKDNGLPPAVFGAEGWRQFLDVADLYHGMLTRPGMFETYRRAKIALAPADWESNYTPMVKLRSLEIASCGPLQIIEEAEDLDDYFERDKEIVSYGAQNWDELVRKIRQYLADDTRRQQIARAGYERLIRDHVWKVRWSEVEDLVRPFLIKYRSKGDSPIKLESAKPEQIAKVDLNTLQPPVSDYKDDNLPHELGLAACAMHYERMGDLNTALLVFEEWEKLSPTCYTMLLGKGRTLLGLRMFEQAEQTFRKALEAGQVLCLRGVDSTVTQRKLGPRNGLGKMFTGIFPRTLESYSHLLLLFAQSDQEAKAEQLMRDLTYSQDLLFVSIVALLAEPNIEQMLGPKYMARYVEVLLTTNPIVWAGEKLRHRAHFWMLRGQAIYALGRREEGRQCLEYAMTQEPYPQVAANIQKLLGVMV